MKCLFSSLVMCFLFVCSLAQGETYRLEWDEGGDWEVGKSRQEIDCHARTFSYKTAYRSKFKETGALLRCPMIPGKNIHHFTAEMMENYLDVYGRRAKVWIADKDLGLEKKHPYLVSMVQTTKYEGRNESRSAIFFVIKGSENYFVGIRSIARKKLPKKKIEEWIAFFKAGEFFVDGTAAQ